MSAIRITKRTRVIFVWDNFGPMHLDRILAAKEKLKNKALVEGIELVEKSQTYSWDRNEHTNVNKITLTAGRSWKSINIFQRVFLLLRACILIGGNYYFFCHYEDPSVFIVACLLRIIGRRVYTMNDSKFDDYERHMLREFGKAIFYLPYHGALASGYRSPDYMRFLGLKQKSIRKVYNALSLVRVRAQAGYPKNLETPRYEERSFVIVARLVEKKNLFLALDAYAIYCREPRNKRALEICGDGPLDTQLREYSLSKGVAHRVRFLGFQQIPEIYQIMGRSVALILPSIEEQFGNVVIEAQSLGIPVLLSTNCGARDEVIRSGVNGFIFEPDNERGLAFFMELIGGNQDLWQIFCENSDFFNGKYDASRFADAVISLINN